jgi:hypothetical protein
VKKHLQKKLRRGSIGSDDEWIRLAKIVLAVARTERFPSRHLKFDNLQIEFDEYRKSIWAKHRSATSSSGEDDEGEDDEHQRHYLAESARYLCQQGILHQGHEWRCRQCFNTNWVSIDDLKRAMVCEVCGRNEPAPVVDSWHFKLNGFVLEGLREHGLLPAIWSLAKCAERADASFFYLEPHELFFTKEGVEKGIADAELDLLVVSDSLVRLIEAKGSRRGLDIANTAELAKRLRPDVVTLAVMEPSSHALTAKRSELEQELTGSDIAVGLMTLDPNDIAPLLPTGGSYWVGV